MTAEELKSIEDRMRAICANHRLHCRRATLHLLFALAHFAQVAT